MLCALSTQEVFPYIVLININLHLFSGPCAGEVYMLVTHVRILTDSVAGHYMTLRSSVSLSVRFLQGEWITSVWALE